MTVSTIESKMKLVDVFLSMFGVNMSMGSSKPVLEVKNPDGIGTGHASVAIGSSPRRLKVWQHEDSPWSPFHTQTIDPYIF